MTRSIFRRSRHLIAAAALVGLAACSGGVMPAPGGPDPAQGFNRAMHGLNKGADTVLLRPLSKGYEYAVPATFKHVINNEVRFVQLPVSFANSVLQGDLNRARQTLARFFVNGTLGGLGALDPATEMGLPEHDEDFGQTLAVWGVPSGPYIELPLLGPSTVRDTFSRAGDMAMSPLMYIGQGSTTELVKAAETPARIIDTRHRFGPIIDQALYESEDSYSTLKNAYIQRRRGAIMNGQITREILPAIYQDEEPF